MSVTYTAPFYVAYAAPAKAHSDASLSIKDSGGIQTALALEYQKFNPVEGAGTYTITGVVISHTPTGKTAVTYTTYQPNSNITIGPNAWGILQFLDTGHIGLSITSSAGEDKRVTFIPSTDTVSIPSQYKVLMKSGSVWNGVSDARLDITYLPEGAAATTTPTTTAQNPNTGNTVGPPFSGSITSFNLQKGDKSTIVKWAPVETVWLKSSMSLVVIGTYAAPSLAIMLEVGGPQTVKLAKITATTTPVTSTTTGGK